MIYFTDVIPTQHNPPPLFKCNACQIIYDRFYWPQVEDGDFKKNVLNTELKFMQYEITQHGTMKVFIQHFCFVYSHIQTEFVQN